MKNRYAEYSKRKMNAIRQAEHLERMSDKLYELNDNELRIDNNTGFYKTNPSVSIEHLAKSSELASDPAFMKLKEVYDSLRGLGHPDFHVPFSPVFELNILATKMANRKLREEEYQDILDGRLNCIYSAQQIIKRSEELKRKQLDSLVETLVVSGANYTG